MSRKVRFGSLRWNWSKKGSQTCRLAIPSSWCMARSFARTAMELAGSSASARSHAWFGNGARLELVDSIAPHVASLLCRELLNGLRNVKWRNELCQESSFGVSRSPKPSLVKVCQILASSGFQSLQLQGEAGAKALEHGDLRLHSARPGQAK